MRDLFQNLFQNLIWPAAAGNVAWALITVAVTEKWSTPGVLPRLALLLVLALSLASDWLATASELKRLKSWYWVGDACHVPAVVVLAIATQMNTPGLAWVLAAVFVVTVFWHLTGAWEPTGHIEKRWQKRIVMAAINGSGLALVLGLPPILPEDSLWHLSLSMLFVMVLWSTLRRRVYAQNGTAQQQHTADVATGRS